MIRSVPFPDHKIRKEAGDTVAFDAKTFHTSFPAKGGKKIGLSNSCGSCDDEVASVFDPLTVSKLCDICFFQFADRIIIQLCQTGCWFLQFRLLDQPFDFGFLQFCILVLSGRRCGDQRSCISKRFARQEQGLRLGRALS